MDNINDFDFDVPPELVAQEPLARRDASRLLVFNRASGAIEHKQFCDIVDCLNTGDLLVFNDTKVFPARIFGLKKTGGVVEILLLREKSPFLWTALLKSGGKTKPGDVVTFADGQMRGEIAGEPKQGQCDIMFKTGAGEFSSKQEFMDMLAKFGKPPLPPYIKRDKLNDEHVAEDIERYQTVFAKKTGAIAAPTAGLHFTGDIIDKIRRKGVEVVFVTLHVGIGTFKPIKAIDYREHVMETEYYEIPENTAQAINRAKSEGRRVVPVGSTSCRVLETIGNDGSAKPSSGWTGLFVYPPYKFKVADALITNFHQPKSTLLLLVSAFAGTENIRRVYNEAKQRKYRFFSYGDSMMIV